MLLHCSLAIIVIIIIVIISCATFPKVGGGKVGVHKDMLLLTHLLQQILFFASVEFHDIKSTVTTLT